MLIRLHACCFFLFCSVCVPTTTETKEPQLWEQKTTCAAIYLGQNWCTIDPGLKKKEEKAKDANGRHSGMISVNRVTPVWDQDRRGIHLPFPCEQTACLWLCTASAHNPAHSNKIYRKDTTWHLEHRRSDRHFANSTSAFKFAVKTDLFPTQ